MVGVLKAEMVTVVICTGIFAAGSGRAVASGNVPDGREGNTVVDATAYLEKLRDSGDLAGQRRHAWAIVAQLFAPTVERPPTLESWYGEGEVFSTSRSQRPVRGIRGFSRASDSRGSPISKSDTDLAFPNAPVFAYTLYNREAYEHIRRHRLYRKADLDDLRGRGRTDREFDSDRSIPPFPSQAIVMKTIWWPVAKGGITKLPVWDPADNPARKAGNSHMQWPRYVSVDPSMHNRDASGRQNAEISNSKAPEVARFPLTAFYHLKVDRRLAIRANLDGEARRASLVALGRPLQMGDYLVLVGVNLATKEIEDWVWATIWWHDRPNQGPFAADRPDQATPRLRRYLLNVAFNSDTPVESTGEPHICFNPWLEARFPDGGGGGGVVSNCLTCHRRASYPLVNFLPITRGAPNRAMDPAFAPGRLRTGFLWSIPLHAVP